MDLPWWVRIYGPSTAGGFQKIQQMGFDWMHKVQKGFLLHAIPTPMQKYPFFVPYKLQAAVSIQNEYATST
jgi:hypothetical protein